MRTLGPENFSAAFCDGFSPQLTERIAGYDFRYEYLGPFERDKWLIKILQTISSGAAVIAGKRRKDQWQNGWNAHLDYPETLIPAYFGKYPIIRWHRCFIEPVSPNFEYHSLCVIQHWLFEKYLGEAKVIYEFGCGTGHSLIRIREANPEADIWGLDWVPASQELVRQAGFKAEQFDFFEPSDFSLEPNSAVFTCAALEQVGENFKPFVDYLLRERPALCIHIEPIDELLFPDHMLLDYLSLEYSKKRGYLSGFLTHLRQLETDGKVKIERAQRTYIGSLFLDGYSIVVWRPL